MINESKSSRLYYQLTLGHIYPSDVPVKEMIRDHLSDNHSTSKENEHYQHNQGPKYFFLQSLLVQDLLRLCLKAVQDHRGCVCVGWTITNRNEYEESQPMPCILGSHNTINDDFMHVY
jgi:hypothetical protein